MTKQVADIYTPLSSDEPGDTVEWSLDDVKDNCTSYQAFPHYNKFGMGEENTPIYLCRDATFDVRKIWWHSHHWN